MTLLFVPTTMTLNKPTHQARFMVWGGIGAGKTTLIRALTQTDFKTPPKTQMIDYHEAAIDTPGEYAERGFFRRHLQSAATDAKILVVVQDATRTSSLFPPHYFLMFPQPVVGVVTKIDLADDAQRDHATQLLQRCGVTSDIFYVSAINGSGLDELRQYLFSYLENLENNI